MLIPPCWVVVVHARVGCPVINSGVVFVQQCGKYETEQTMNKADKEKPCDISATGLLDCHTAFRLGVVYSETIISISLSSR